VAYLGDLRVRCNEIKAEVEAKIEDYKEKVHNARSIEKQIQVIFHQVIFTCSWVLRKFRISLLSCYYTSTMSSTNQSYFLNRSIK
jgi:hypothetical protein